MSAACTRINNEPQRRDQRVQQHPQLTRRSQPSPDHERNPRSEAACAGRLDQRNDRPAPTRFPSQQPQKQDEAHAAKTYPCKNELICSAVTQGEELLMQPVVEQLAMTGSRSGKSTNNLQWHGSRTVCREPPRRTQHHLVPDVRNNRVETAKSRRRQVWRQDGVLHFFT